METVKFGLDEHGRFFVITAYGVDGRMDCYCCGWDESIDYNVSLRGRKALFYDTGSQILPFVTAWLDGWRTGRALRTRIARLSNGDSVSVNLVNLDELTGRLLIAVDYSMYIEPICRVYLADLPE